MRTVFQPLFSFVFSPKNTLLLRQHKKLYSQIKICAPTLFRTAFRRAIFTDTPRIKAKRIKHVGVVHIFQNLLTFALEKWILQFRYEMVSE